MNKPLYEILQDMISEGKISERTIMMAAKISHDELKQYLSGINKNIKSEDVAYLDELTMQLSFGLTFVNQDERIKGILDMLINYFGFQSAELSKLLDIDEEIIQRVYDGKEIDIHSKLHLAVSDAHLFYVLKRGRQE